MFVMNQNGHYFEINTKEIIVSKERFQDCRFFDDEKSLLDAVCSESGCDLDEVACSTFYITMRDGLPKWIDDRGFVHAIDEPVETFVATFVL